MMMISINKDHPIVSQKQKPLDPLILYSFHITMKILVLTNISVLEFYGYIKSISVDIFT